MFNTRFLMGERKTEVLWKSAPQIGARMTESLRVHSRQAGGRVGGCDELKGRGGEGL